MKKVVFIILCVIFMSSCNSGEKFITPILSGISFTAEIDYYNEYFACDVTIDQDKTMKLTVTQPQDISGMKLIFSGDKVTAEYMGITYTPHTDTLPVGGVAQTLYSIIRQLDDDTVLETQDGKNCIFKGRIDDRAFSFSFTPSGLPLCIDIPDQSFSIKFSKVEVK